MTENVTKITREVRQYQLHEEVIPETTTGSVVTPLSVPYANHGKNIVRNRAGRWFCGWISDRGARGQAFLSLAVSDKPDARGGELHAPIMLAGTENRWWPSHFPSKGTTLQSVCLLMDAEDRLHVLFSDAEGIFHLGADASGGRPAIGFLVVAGDQVYFDSLSVPEYASTERRKIVFLDNLELDEMIGVDHRIGEWKKEPAPVPFGDPPAWVDVHRTDEGFAMRYSGLPARVIAPHPTVAPYSGFLAGRATSPDGLKWTIQPPFDLSKLTLDGKPFPGDFWYPLYLEDPEEKDPGRRFKGIMGSYLYTMGVELRLWEVVVSPDGLAWRTMPELDPVLSGDISVPHHLLRDDEDKDPNRRFKAVMLMGCHAGRAVVVFTSPDVLHWSRVVWLRADPDDKASPPMSYPTGPIALDPDAAEDPWEEEVHDAVLWRENGHLMMHYDAFYFHYNQHISKALAISRDGRHYWRIKRGAINMPHGNCGEWDNGRDRTSVPVRVGDELWLYFVGMPASYFADPEASVAQTLEWTGWNAPANPGEIRPWQLGLTRLRVDGWGCVERRREAQAGHITTIPFRYDGGDLIVNGSGLDGVKVELCTADNGSVVSGFEAANRALDSVDSVCAHATWKGQHQPRAGRVSLTVHS